MYTEFIVFESRYSRFPLASWRYKYFVPTTTILAITVTMFSHGQIGRLRRTETLGLPYYSFGQFLWWGSATAIIPATGDIQVGVVRQ